MDQLSQYLLQHYNSYLTGYQDCNMLLWGLPQQEYSVPKFMSMVVGFNYDPNKFDVNQSKRLINYFYNTNEKFRKIINYGKAITEKSRLPFIVLLYPSLDKFRKVQWEKSEEKYAFKDVSFGIYEINSQSIQLDVMRGSSLREKLCELIGSENIRVQGTSKAKNKSIADYFQYWSRAYMPSSLTKIDIDGGFFDNGTNQIFVEIKRSNVPPIPEWRPYTRDKANFRLQYDFCRETDMACWILHHDGLSSNYDDNTIISFFDVERWNDNPRNPADFFIYKQMVPELLLGGENSLDSIIRNEYHMR